MNAKLCEVIKAKGKFMNEEYSAVVRVKEALNFNSSCTETWTRMEKGVSLTERLRRSRKRKGKAINANAIYINISCKESMFKRAEKDKNAKSN